MSSGFAGNIGKPLPPNWAYDQISTVKIGKGVGLLEIDNNIMSGRDGGVLVNPDVPFNLIESEKKEYIRNKTNEILSSLKLREITGAEYEINKEIQLAITENVEVYAKITYDVALNKNAIYSVGITNRKFNDPDFSVEFANMKASLKGIDKKLIPDVDSLATEIGNGRLEISVSGDANRTVFEIKSIVLSTENDTLKQDFAVIVKIVYHNNMSRPVQLAQEVWDLFLEDIKTIKAPDTTYTDRLMAVFYVIAISLVIALCIA